MANGVSRILIADDHEIVLRCLSRLLEPQLDLEVVAQANESRGALAKAFECNPDIAVVDYAANDLDLLSEWKERLPMVKVLIYTRGEGEETALAMLNEGASGYVLKSDPDERLLATIRALANHRTWVAGDALQNRFSSGKKGKLTPRELDVVRLLAQGFTNPTVATDLGISIKTVETHRSAVMHKLGLGNTADLVRYAIRNHIIDA